MASLAHPAALLALLITLLSASLRADVPAGSPMLHEYIPPDNAEDVALAESVPAGQLPPALRTPSGTIHPPDLRTTPEPRRVYHPSDRRQATFRPDRDTRRPQIEHYDDPFTPSLTPFKRMEAYDAVHEDYSLYVRDPQLRPLPVGGGRQAGDDHFFGDMAIALRAGDAVRVPTVGPGARLLTAIASPRMELSFWHDGADNWFVRSAANGRVRLVTEIAIARAALASEFDDVPWAALPRVPLQPASHAQAYRKVARAIGIGRHLSPRQVVAKMVEYFRSFAASSEPPSGHGDIYLDLALSKKGVCRHRAFAFLVTALHAGIPARLVVNEAHAWVEVRDDRQWHRIDLGGAAVELADEPHLDRPPHVPPPDQFAWPAGRDSGAELAGRPRAAAAARQSREPGAAAPGRDPFSSAPPAAGGGSPAAGGAGPVDLPRTTLSIDSIDHDIFRGLPLKLQGTASSSGQRCAQLRVDVALLIRGARAPRRIGSLSTDERGIFAGEVVVPPDVPIGDHELMVRTPGGGECGPGQAQ